MRVREEYLNTLTKAQLVDLVLKTEANETQERTYHEISKTFVAKISEALAETGNKQYISNPAEFIRQAAKVKEGIGQERAASRGFHDGVRTVLLAQGEKR